MAKKSITVAVLLLLGFFLLAGGLYAQRKYTIRLNEKTLRLETMEINGKVWVPLQDVSNALGIRYKADEEKSIIDLEAPANFIVSPRFVTNDDKVLDSRYYFKLSYAQGSFSMDVLVNGKKIGTYNAEADVEITRYLKPGKNTLETTYRFIGGNSGFYFAIQELTPSNERINLDEMDIIYTETSSRPRTGKKAFNIDAR